ncbi:MAG: beta strand repeat-containing protein [Candidatus Spyradenecus sp.]
MRRLFEKTGALLAASLVALPVWAATPVYLFDCGSTEVTDAGDTWKHLTKQGSYPAFLQNDTKQGDVYFTSTSGGNFFDNTTNDVDNLPQAGTYVTLSGESCTTVWEEMAKSLGLTVASVPASVYADGLANGGTTNHTVTVSGLDSSATYVLYYVGGRKRTDSVSAGGGFTLLTYGGTPQVDYVATVAGTNTSVATAYTTVSSVGTQLRAGKNGLLVVRVSGLKTNSSGTVTFQLPSERAVINCLAIAKTEVDVTRTFAGGASEVWSTADAWSGGATPTGTDAVTVTVSADSTVTLDTAATAKSLSVQGDGALTFAPATGEGVPSSLTTTAATIGANVDVSGVSASLGTVSIASGKALTISSLEQLDGCSGSGTLVFNGNSTIDETSKLGANMPLRIIGGTVQYTAAGAQNGLAYGRTIEVSGTGTILETTKQDATGWGISGTQKFIVKDEATLQFDSRETFKTPLELTKGTLQLKAAQSNRAIDFFNDAAATTDIKVLAGTHTAPVVSTITSDGSTDADKTALIRQNGGTASSDNKFSVDVETNATLKMDVILASSVIYMNNGRETTESGSAPLQKLGGGVLELTCANTYITGTLIDGGTVKLSGSGTLGTGAVAIASGARLETTKAFTNALSGTGTLAIGGADTFDLHTTLAAGSTLTFELASEMTGKLILPAGLEGTLTVPSTATLELVLSEEQLNLTGYSATGVTGGVTFKKLNANNEVVALEATDGTAANGTFTPSPNTWQGDTAEEDGTTYLWSNAANWSRNTVPGENDWPSLSFTEGMPAPVLTENVTLKAVTLKGACAIDVAGYKFSVGKLIGDGIDASSLAISGTGTLHLKANEDFARKVASDITISVAAGATLATELAGQGSTNPIIENVALVFADGAKWQSHGWLGLAGAVSVENAGALTFDAYAGYVPSLEGDGSFEKRGTGELTVNCMGASYANAFTLTAGTLALRLSTATVEATGAQVATPFTGTLSGNGKLKLLQGTLSLPNANTYAGGTEIAANATVAISHANALGSGAVTGAGTIATSVYPTSGTGTHNLPASISGLTASAWKGTLKFTTTLSGLNGINFPNLGNANSTIEIAENVGLTGYFSASPWNVESLLKLNGTLTLNDGLSPEGGVEDNGYSFQKLEGSGTFSVTKTTIKLPIRFKGDMSNFKGTLSLPANAQSAFLFGPSAYTGTNAAEQGRCFVEAGASVTMGEGSTWTTPKGAVVAGTLGGAGTVSALTLQDGAKVDASAGVLTVSGAVTIADDAVVTVVPPATPAAGDEILKCTSAATVAAKLSGAPAGFLFGANEADSAVVLVKPAVSLPEGTEGALSTAAQETLEAIAAENGLATATVSGLTNCGATQTTPLSAEAIGDVLTVFEHVCVADTTAQTITVAYDFGIAEMEQPGDGTLVVVAKVSSPTGNAAFADGVTVTLEALDGTTTSASYTSTTISGDTARFANIAVADLAGKKLKVKVSK